MSSCCSPPRDPSNGPEGAAQAPTPGDHQGGTLPKAMVTIPAGPFTMGNDQWNAIVGDRESPTRTVEVATFRLGATAVTNAQFTAFVDATGHTTEAETFGWSFVFLHQVHPEARAGVMPKRISGAPWWRGVEGANWRTPEGPGSDITDRLDHPVVHVSWNDARACASWMGGRLPTEPEWEKAARGGREEEPFPWGTDLTPDGVHMANIWQGDFPDENTGEDGFLGLAPVGSFPANDVGLFDMAGNAWEWTADPWQDGETSKAMRGGSYLCHASYCARYRVSARTRNEPDATSGHLGFRVAADG